MEIRPVGEVNAEVGPPTQLTVFHLGAAAESDAVAVERREVAESAVEEVGA